MRSMEEVRACVSVLVNDWIATSVFGNDEITSMAPIRPFTPANGNDCAGTCSMLHFLDLDPTRCGVGRILRLKQAWNPEDIMRRVCSAFSMDHVRFSKAEKTSIRTVALCAGSGGSVLRDVEADMYITGELGHHEVLHARHKHAWCLLAEHSNTERGYLSAVLAQRLSKELQSMGHAGSVLVSESDAEPIQLFLAR